ncbi:MULTISPECIES: DUF4347 domain-containing protein [unclassified Leptolyngbya]|uniref:DUF4347 domain-containing protein n=1 Tax=unclassified Leptolyngbya TaxID=2650499 RepID=UPI0016847A90|nr:MULTISPECIES: DUF4347 domain-containing protein [unclassified Leptolyngbya]MBD1911721.1 DUF4347 domain-containing protein [Leptolyngbya sp. FACHB-8]MBD2154636.1 DUF4347 domain-containing protein [Leptolyngbya sp. FACHB-16]
MSALTAVIAPHIASSPTFSTLVAIDPNVSDYEILVSGVLPDVSVIVLDDKQDVINQITAALQQHPTVKTLHLLAHGAPGVLFVGNKPLKIESLEHYRRELRYWTIESLFIYGCQVGLGNVGMEFLQKLHCLTGAAIAASTTKTGSAALGGNWRLEVSIGTPQPPLAFDEAIQQLYPGVLELLNADDYAALKALYQSTGGENWTDNTGWKDWDFNSNTPPDVSVVSQWKGVSLMGDRVTSIGLSSNYLSGTIPVELGTLSELQSLNLYGNQLTGSIPSELGNLANLTHLYLNNNQLNGEVPQPLVNQFGNSITDYDLSNAPFVTTIANQSINVNQSLTLNLSISDIDTAGNDTNLTLSVTSNATALIDSNGISISGTGSDRVLTLTPIAGQGGSATITMTLQDGNGEETAKTFTLDVVGVPLNAQDYAALKALYENTGGANWTNKKGWKDWDFSSNTPPDMSVVSHWRGVTVTGDRVVALSLPNNNLSGTIPPELGNLSNLTSISFGFNHLSGTIPPELGNLSKLTNLALRGNQLSGSIPPALGNLINLSNLGLRENQLSGSIPEELGNLTNLASLLLDNNQLSGSIPTALGNLSNLQSFSLNNNNLSGVIPTELGNLSKLALVELSHNQLSGSIPTQLSNLANLEYFHLNNNQLSGEVPEGIVSKLGNKIVDYNLDNAPFVSAITHQTTTTDRSLWLNLSISDLDTGGNNDPAGLTLTAVSSNTTLIGARGIAFSGTGSDRVLTLTPNSGYTGNATITLTLQDTSGEKTQKTFALTVNIGSTVTSLFDTPHNKFVVSNALLNLNPETLRSGSSFLLRNGTANANRLYGTGSKDAIFGRDGNDQIWGQGGHDFMAGGRGNDIINGGAGNDLIFGASGRDTLVGGTGDDILIGGGTGDRITTGTGRDKVGFANLTSGNDIITDFNAAADVMVVSAAAFGGGLRAGTLAATQFHVGSRAIGAEDRFIYNRQTGSLIFDADGAGRGGAIAFATLKPGLSLSSQNFMVV